MQEVERLRGRAGVRQRLRRLMAEPLCRHCFARGKVIASSVPDHIIPLSQGGTDDDDNIQCLCDECHLIKTAAETVAQGVAFYPLWLERSAVPLTIVSGPPCSGKTTFVENRVEEADTVICLDTIFQRLRPGYQHWSGLIDPDFLGAAIRVRNAMLAQLARARSGKAWFIVSAPHKDERAWWHRMLGGEVVYLHPGVAECQRRAVERGTPKAAAGVLAWERASKEPWCPPRPRPTKSRIGLDGWPVE